MYTSANFLFCFWLKQLREKIKPSKMRCFVREFGAFPQENRALVWRCLMQVPLNHSSFRPLVIKAMDINLPQFWDEWISQRDELRSNTVLQLNRCALKLSS
jgi:hypothetical protein